MALTIMYKVEFTQEWRLLQSTEQRSLQERKCYVLYTRGGVYTRRMYLCENLEVRMEGGLIFEGGLLLRRYGIICSSVNRLARNSEHTNARNLRSNFLLWLSLWAPPYIPVTCLPCLATSVGKYCMIRLYSKSVVWTWACLAMVEISFWLLQTYWVSCIGCGSHIQLLECHLPLSCMLTLKSGMTHSGWRAAGSVNLNHVLTEDP